MIGSGNYWPSSFPVASSNLAPGTYYLQVVAINQGGPGAILGNFSVGSQSFSTSSPGWAAVFNSNNSTFTPQPWVAPNFSNPADAVQVYGPNNGQTSPWSVSLGQNNQPIAGISTSADWIDGIGLNSLTVNGGNSTVDFSYAFTVPGPTPGAGLAGLVALILAGAAAKRRGFLAR